MYSKLFRNKAIFVLAGIILLFTVLFSANTLRTVIAEETQLWNNYNIVTSSGNFVGVDINNSARGSLSVAIPTGSATVPAVTGEHGAGIGLVTFELGAVNPFESTGLLIQIDRRHATANQGPRIYIEAQDGTLYRFSDSTVRNDVFIKEDGTVSSMKSENSHRYTLTSNVCGTLYVPWSVLTSTGTKTPHGTGTPSSAGSAVAQGTVFTRLHFGLDMRNTGWHGENRATAFGTIATVNVNGAQTTATELLNVAKLTYSIDADNTEADVNLSDITKGNKVYARHSISEVFVFDETPQVVAETIAIHSWTRTSAEITINYVDGEGQQLMTSVTEVLPYNITAGTFPYQITAPSIAGYEYDTTSAELTGFVSNNDVINLVYQALPAPKLTAKYIDGAGNTIKTSEIIYTEYDSQTGICSYSLQPAHVFGYNFVSADKQLEGTFTEDTEIMLTYTLSFNNYDVIKDSNGVFAGIDINNSMTGALVADVSAFNGGTGYGIITVELDRVDPFMSTGFLLQFARLNTGSAQVRMYIEAEDGTMYRFFSGPQTLVPARNDVLINTDGSISSVSNDSTNNRHMFTSNQAGTLYIPWDKVFKIGNNTPIASGTVFTKFHFGREMRYESSVNKPIALGTIAAVKVDGDYVLVEELVNISNLTYTAEAENITGDVNLTNYENGKKVYVGHWATGAHIFDTDADRSLYEATLGIWNFKRVPPKITLNFVDENGKTIKAPAKEEAVYAASGSTYNIAPFEITGYTFDHSDKPLSGMADTDTVITLVYNFNSNQEYNLAASYNNGNITISVVEGYATYEYQFWIKTRIATDNFSGNAGKERYTWKMAAAYSNSASASINVSGADYVIDNIYEVIVRIKDNNGIFVEELHGKFTIEDLGQVYINTSAVNGKNGEKLYVIDKAEGSFTVNITTNIDENVTYSIYDKESLITSNTSGEFEINITDAKEGYYNYKLIASNGISQDETTIRVYIFGEYKANEIAVIDSLTGTSSPNGATTFTMKLKYADGNNITAENAAQNYNIKLMSENKAAIFVNYTYSETGELQAVFNIDYNNRYGIYRMRGSISRKSIMGEDDFTIEYYNGYVRNAQLSQQSTGDVYEIGNTVTITASGSINNHSGNLYYAFYREDAAGWVMIKDYSIQNQLNWTPTKAGIYKIQVRLKAENAGSYEKVSSKEYIITGEGLTGQISIEAFDYAAGTKALTFQAGKPYSITAQYLGDEDTLYMFTVYNKNQGLSYINHFTTNNSIVFIPNKQDDFIITVRIINVKNFGYKDISKNITINS